MSALHNLDLKSDHLWPFAYLDNAFSSAEVDEIIRLGQQLDHSDAAVGSINDTSVKKDQGEILLQYRTCKIGWFKNPTNTRWLFDRVIDCMNQLNRGFFGYDLEMIEHLQFTHYHHSRQEFYSKHMDSVFGLESSMATRKLSITVQLSDPANYEGGELELYLGGDSMVTVPKQRGTMIVFPSFLIHQVTPVTAGERYSLVTWAHGPRFR